ncbi:PAS domain S-box protein [Novosphingobium sp. PS1R-30]|uniref:histidine kinase n=1 Tax=Novosphingobium anseongense TaxID=3133436 RepID=A0ABU8S2K7_9SPHN
MSQSTMYDPKFDAGLWLSSVVDNSGDAILSKTLDGIITSWNAGAERLFGFTANEAIGQPITLIIPEDRLHEEADIISKLRAGERIDRFETVRRRSDGASVHIEVTISPVRNAAGAIIGRQRSRAISASVCVMPRTSGCWSARCITASRTCCLSCRASSASAGDGPKTSMTSPTT